MPGIRPSDPRETTAIPDDLVDGLAEAMRVSLGNGLCCELLRLLAEGRPVSIERLAAATARPAAEMAAEVRRLPNIEFDDDGNVVGQGITLVPTPHRFLVGWAHALHRCAWDTLVFPSILGRPARAESPCPVTGTVVRVEVGTHRLERVEPEGAVVSMVVPERVAACCDGRSAFCDHVHFFATREAAAQWLARRPGGAILSVAEAYDLGRRVR